MCLLKLTLRGLYAYMSASLQMCLCVYIGNVYSVEMGTWDLGTDRKVDVVAGGSSPLG